MTTRRNWRCDGGCGCGTCCEAGTAPTEIRHVLMDGRVCGTFRDDGPCEACEANDRREAS